MEWSSKKDKKNNRKFLIYIHVFLQWWSISLKASNCKFFKVQSSMNISWSIWFYFESKHDIIQRKSKIPWPTFIEIRSPSSINMEVNVLFTVLWYCLQKKCKNLFNADFNFYHLLSKILLYWKWLLILETFCNKKWSH